MRTINDYVKEAHEANKRWWVDLETEEPIDRDPGELLMLCVTELAEAMEGIRKGLMDDKLPHRTMEEVEIADFLIRVFDFCGGKGVEPCGPEIESLNDLSWVDYHGFRLLGNTKGGDLFKIVKSLAEPYALLTDFSQPIGYALAYGKKYGLDLEGAYREKMAYNASREDHKLENRRKEGGKKL